MCWRLGNRSAQRAALAAMIAVGLNPGASAVASVEGGDSSSPARATPLRQAKADRLPAVWRSRADLQRATSRSQKPAMVAGARASAGVPETIAEMDPSEVDQLGDAIQLVQKGRFEEASLVAKSLSDPLAHKLIEWLILRTADADIDFERLAAFADANGHWPMMSTIRRRAEEALLSGKTEPARVFAYFKTHEPVSPAGRLALAIAHLRSGNRSRAETLASDAWRDADLDKATEKSVLAALKPVLDEDDHRRRLLRLLYDRENDAALRTAKRLDRDRVALARAVRAYHRRSGRGWRLYKKLSADMRGQVVMYYARVRYLRRRHRDTRARTVLAKLLKSEAKFTYPGKWWTERRILARRALAAGKASAAYAMVERNDFEPGPEYAENEFLAGFIAFTRLKDTRLALTRFRRMREAAERDSRKAKADYWIGLALLRLDKREEAAKHFAQAAVHTRTFYGQLANDALGRKPVRIDFSNTPVASDEEKAALAADDLARAARLLERIGERDLVPPFVIRLAYRLKSEGKLAALAELAWELEAPHLAVRTAKIALRRGFELGGHLYPRNALPKYQPLTPTIESAFLMGLARQESEFNAKAVSHAGARGMMQLMPATARMVARSHKQRYSVKRLTRDPRYNVMLGSAHLHDLLQAYDGSYIMTAAGYNAGPGNVRKWVRAFGDPRDKDVDPLDWIESITYDETRNYVKQVLKNTVIYRSRLGETPRALSAELRRGAKSK